MIVIWDADSATPYQHIFQQMLKEEEPAKHFFLSLDISSDFNYLVTLANKTNDKGEFINQNIMLWRWKDSIELTFHCDFNDIDKEVYKLVRFNPKMDTVNMEILLNGKKLLSN